MESDASQWMMILRTLGSLALVIGIIYGLSFFAQKYLLNLKMLKSETGPIRILSQMPIDAKKRLTVIEIKGRQLLLGVSEQNISLVAELTPAESAEVRHG